MGSIFRSFLTKKTTQCGRKPQCTAICQNVRSVFTPVSSIKMVECRLDSPPPLVNLKSNTIMKKPLCKYKKEINIKQIISIKKEIFIFCVKLIVASL